MKKKSLYLLIFLVVILGACSNNSNELEGEVFRVFTWSPSISPEDISSDNFNPSSALEFDFKSSDEVEVQSGGETFEGNYSLENNTLSVDLKDENDEDSAVIEFSDFTQHEQNEKLYTGTISNIDLKTDGHVRIGNIFSFDNYLGFYKND